MSMSSLIRYPFLMLRDLHSLVNDARERGLQSAFSEVMRPDAPGTWQLIKYLVIGVLSVVIFMAVCALFRILAINVFDASYADHRVFWNLVEIAVGFVPTNAFTYATNRRWVFVAGRHHPRKEFILFSTAALFSIFAAEMCAYYFMTQSSWGDFLIKIAVIVISTVVNFTFRKLVVFHG
jgi:putative flippase GtrA